MTAQTSDSATGITDLRAFLEGAWRLTRTLEDRRAGETGGLEGEAVFSPEGCGLLYRERGFLCFGAYRHEVGRIYRYAFPAPHVAEVRFEDGRAFHGLDLSGGCWLAEHRCGADLYRGTFRVAGPSAWRALWHITGPRKGQALESRYLRTG